MSPDLLVVLLGRYNLHAQVEKEAVQRKVEDIHIHPDWDVHSVKWDADIALLTLTKTVEFSRYIQPICLPRDLRIEKYEVGMVVS